MLDCFFMDFLESGQTPIELSNDTSILNAQECPKYPKYEVCNISGIT